MTCHSRRPAARAGEALALDSPPLIGIMGGAGRVSPSSWRPQPDLSLDQG